MRIRLVILFLFIASLSFGQASWWYGNAGGSAPAGPDTLTLTYWDDFILLHIANTGITEDVNGVSAWQDRSGNGNHSTQTVNINKPSTDVDGNVVFDGTNDYLESPVLWATGADSAYTYFIVLEVGSTITQNRAIPYWYEGNNTNLLSNTFYVAIDSVTGSSTSADFWFAARDTVNPSTEWRVENLGSTSVNQKNVCVIAASETTTAEFFVNGSQVGSLTSDGTWYGDFFEPSLGAGRRSELLVPFNGKILFLGVAGRKFSSSEIATTNSELNSFFTIY